jgi:hypothetical protein
MVADLYERGFKRESVDSVSDFFELFDLRQLAQIMTSFDTDRGETDTLKTTRQRLVSLSSLTRPLVERHSDSY